jgi:hypothetical protein
MAVAADADNRDRRGPAAPAASAVALELARWAVRLLINRAEAP